ncbi:MAG: FeoB-associated Cys-rich membrane protein [Erysipelotrichaceae bacterium]|nr:FeoB-associated Cys-rich membrane protein [Erysipelotrichaceae bacterium]
MGSLCCSLAVLTGMDRSPDRQSRWRSVMNWGNLIVIAVIAILVMLALRTIHKDKTSCNNICSGCAFGATCTRKQNN